MIITFAQILCKTIQQFSLHSLHCDNSDYIIHYTLYLIIFCYVQTGSDKSKNDHREVSTPIMKISIFFYGIVWCSFGGVW